MDDKKLIKAAEWLIQSKHTTVFTGAGISVESGIPPFRGENGLWSRYEPHILDLEYFHSDPLPAWKAIKEIFYDFFGEAKPNDAHLGIARLEKLGIVKSVITQNIDNLHQLAGSDKVHEFHGNSMRLTCTSCSDNFDFIENFLAKLPPECPTCKGLLKPDFIFFGEAIPQDAYMHSMNEANVADLFLVIGTTGEVIPAAYVPHIAKQNGAKIVEVNMSKSAFTNSITDLFLQGSAAAIMKELVNLINKKV